MNKDATTKDAVQQKLETIREYMERGIAMIHLDPRKDGVLVPERFRSDPVLRLNFAYGFRLPALTIDEEGVYAILNFGGERAAVSIPWSAVFAITAPEQEHQGRLWPDDVPLEMVAELAGLSRGPAKPELDVAEAPPEDTKPDRPRPGGGRRRTATRPDPAPQGGREPGAQRPHLRLVK